MTVKDHPRYVQWSVALDRYVAIEKEYAFALMQERPAPEIEALKVERDRAEGGYHRIADSLEQGDAARS